MIRLKIHYFNSLLYLSETCSFYKPIGVFYIVFNDAVGSVGHGQKITYDLKCSRITYDEAIFCDLNNVILC